MSVTVILALMLSIILSAGRNLLSKSISIFPYGTRNFYGMQTTVFFSGFIALLIPASLSCRHVSFLTLVYSGAYALLLITAQWGYTAALGGGSIAICATVYSLGFIFPTVSGAIFWDESFGLRSVFGLLMTVLAVIISGYNTNDEKFKSKYFFPLFLAMAASGGLGIMQKLQQNSPIRDQREMFILFAFLFAGAVSLIFKKNSEYQYSVPVKLKIFSIGAGICFGCCNVLNTYLAGKLSSAFFFPVQNISVIIVSILLSILFLNEYPGKKGFAVLALGSAAILLLN